MRYLIIILILLISIAMVLFGAQNTQSVEVQFLSYRSGMVSLSLVVIIAAIGGALLIGLVNMWGSIQRSFRERASRKKLEQRIRELETIVAQQKKDASALRSVAEGTTRAASTEQRAGKS